jgi:hypothetical protein
LTLRLPRKPNSAMRRPSVPTTPRPCRRSASGRWDRWSGRPSRPCQGRTRQPARQGPFLRSPDAGSFCAFVSPDVDAWCIISRATDSEMKCAVARTVCRVGKAERAHRLSGEFARHGGHTSLCPPYEVFVARMSGAMSGCCSCMSRSLSSGRAGRGPVGSCGLRQPCLRQTGSAMEYFTWLSAKLDSIEAMPSSLVSFVLRNASYEERSAATTRSR